MGKRNKLNKLPIVMSCLYFAVATGLEREREEHHFMLIHARKFTVRFFFAEKFFFTILRSRTGLELAPLPPFRKRKRQRDDYFIFPIRSHKVFVMQGRGIRSSTSWCHMTE